MLDRSLFGAQRLIHDGSILRVVTDCRQVALAHCPVLERPGQEAGGLGVQPEHQHTGGRPIQAVHRVDSVADLVAPALEHELTICAQAAAVVHQPGGLVDRHVVAAPVQQA